MGRIFLVRHGITEGNKKKWYYGTTDLPLTDEGVKDLIRQREEGVYRELEECSTFVVTPYRRTRETLQLISGSSNVKALVFEELGEMQFGDFECKTYEELKENQDFNCWAWDETGDISLPGGESRNQFSTRVKEGWKNLLSLYDSLEEGSKKIAVVCHGGVIASIMEDSFREEGKNFYQWIPKPGYGFSIEVSKEGLPVSWKFI